MAIFQHFSFDPSLETMKKKVVYNKLKFWKASRNQKRSICWKFQLSNPLGRQKSPSLYKLEPSWTSPFDPSLLTNKLQIVFMGKKHNNILFWKKNQNGRLKQCFSKLPILNIFCENFMDWSLVYSPNYLAILKKKMFFWVSHFDFFLLISYKKFQSLFVSWDGSKFWSTQTWRHILAHAKHFEGRCRLPIMLSEKDFDPIEELV